MLRDRRLGRIWRDKEPAERFGSFNLIHRNAILEMEPPDHTRLRRLISTAFARGHVERLRPWVRGAGRRPGRRPGRAVRRLRAGRRPHRDGRAAAGRRHRRAAGGAGGRPAAAAAVVERDREDVRVRPDDGDRGGRRARGRRVRRPICATLAAERRTAPGDDLLSHLVQRARHRGRPAHRGRAGHHLHPAAQRRPRGDGERQRQRPARAARAPRPAAAAARGPGAAADGDRGADALRLPAAAVRAHRHRGRRDRRGHGAGRAEDRRAARQRPTATRRSSPTRTPSTSAAPTTRTSPSAPASTSASGRRWPASSCRPRSGRCSTGRRRSSSGGPRGAVRSSSSAACAELPVVLTRGPWPTSRRCSPRLAGARRSRPGWAAWPATASRPSTAYGVTLTELRTVAQGAGPGPRRWPRRCGRAGCTRHASWPGWWTIAALVDDAQFERWAARLRLVGPVRPGLPEPVPADAASG